MNNKIREALEKIEKVSDGCGSCWRGDDIRFIVHEALVLLDAPVASDARELARKLAEIDDSPHARYSDAYFNEATTLIESLAAERERKAREETARKCADMYCSTYCGYECENRSSCDLRNDFMAQENL